MTGPLGDVWINEESIREKDGPVANREIGNHQGPGQGIRLKYYGRSFLPRSVAYCFQRSLPNPDESISHVRIEIHAIDESLVNEDNVIVRRVSSPFHFFQDKFKRRFPFNRRDILKVAQQWKI